MRMFSWVPFVITLSLLLSSCSSSINQASLRASNNVPSASVVEDNIIPYNAKYPKYVVIVEPINGGDYSTYTAGTICSLGNTCDSGVQIYNGYSNSQSNAMQSQMISALAKIGNISVADLSSLKKRSDGTYSVKLQPGEVGPFIIKGALTELNEVSQEKEQSGFSLGPLGIAMGIAGAIAGKPGLTWPGAALAGINPGYESSELERTGIVALDLQIYDARSLRLVNAFDVKGTFTAKSTSSGIQLFWSDNAKEEFAQSALGQALRIALRDASSKTFDSLKGKRVK